MLKTWWMRRRLKKQARAVLHHARHVRHMREDRLPAQTVGELRDMEKNLKRLLRARQWDRLPGACEALDRWTLQAAPPRPYASFRENIEVIAVAIAVAMGVRSYFLQPFKIPTGSMQPTLYGIHTETVDQPGWSDRWPFKPVKWLLLGEWYTTIRARESGYLLGFQLSESDPSKVFFNIGQTRHWVPKDALDPQYRLRFQRGEFVRRGEVIWAGIRRAGDHVFVDKVRWNFMKPRRGQVAVFATTGIRDLPQGTHYIKRVAGCPGETVSIEPPFLIINGRRVDDAPMIRRIEAKERAAGGELYSGYASAGLLSSPERRYALDAEHYFALGDNTFNSRDSRYWGGVPRDNLLGPACVVYWPLSRRWGLVP